VHKIVANTSSSTTYIVTVVCRL